MMGRAATAHLRQQSLNGTVPGTLAAQRSLEPTPDETSQNHHPM